MYPPTQSLQHFYIPCRTASIVPVISLLTTTHPISGSLDVHLDSLCDLRNDMVDVEPKDLAVDICRWMRGRGRVQKGGELLNVNYRWG